MPVIARDAVASDHLVYAWPFPIGPEEYEVACADDEQVVMCPAWMVGGLLGPGRHRWRTPDPTRPVSAFFVLTAPVEVSFDMSTSFQLPTTGQPVRLRAGGSLQVRAADPALLIAQFVGLPFDAVNDGILRSVSRSVERMLARLLTRRVVMAGTPVAVTDPTMLQGIVEELIAYNPAAGAVFGVELIRMGHLAIAADDGTQPYSSGEWLRNGDPERATARSPARTDPSLLETVRAPRPHDMPTIQPPFAGAAPPPPAPAPRRGNPPLAQASGEISTRPRPVSEPPPAARVITTPVPAVRHASAHDVPTESEDRTIPEVEAVRSPVGARVGSDPGHGESRGSILGIGVGHIGSPQGVSQVSGEIAQKIAPGARVLVPGPNGLMQSATVRQLLQGYYELEVGSSGETIWVPINGVVPEG